MKKFIVSSFLILTSVFLLSGILYAEMPCGMDKAGCDKQCPMNMCGMAGKGMMGGMEGNMMGSGMMGEMMDVMMTEHRHMMQIISNLNLDEKQKETVAEVKKKVMKELIRKKASRQIAGIELKELLAKDPVDMKAVEAKLKEKEGLKTDTLMTVIKAMEEVKSKLTPEQKKKMKEMIEKTHSMDGMGEMSCKCHEGMPNREGKKEEKMPLKHQH